MGWKHIHTNQGLRHQHLWRLFWLMRMDASVWSARELKYTLVFLVWGKTHKRNWVFVRFQPSNKAISHWELKRREGQCGNAMWRLILYLRALSNVHSWSLGCILHHGYWVSNSIQTVITGFGKTRMIGGIGVWTIHYNNQGFIMSELMNLVANLNVCNAIKRENSGKRGNLDEKWDVLVDEVHSGCVYNDSGWNGFVWEHRSICSELYGLWYSIYRIVFSSSGVQRNWKISRKTKWTGNSGRAN